MQPEEPNPTNAGKLFIVSAPAGTGKTTLVNRLKQQVPYLRETISCTTRQPRESETHGLDYFFMKEQDFREAIEQEAFLEWVKLYNDYYGTLKEQVKLLQNQSYHVIMVIDTQGALRIKEQVPATLIFISPPSLDELRRRLKGRGTESHEVIEQRLEWAKHELQQAHLYDYNIINDNLEEAYATLKNIIQRQERR